MASKLPLVSDKNEKQQSFFHSFPELTHLRNLDEITLQIKQDLYQSVFRRQSFVKGLSREKAERLFEDFYWLIYQYIKNQFQQRSSPSSSFSSTSHNPPPPLFIGLSAPQGSGKTTLTEMMEQFFAREGIKLVFMSLDDFYLTGEEQDRLHSRFPENNLLLYRGNAGTHDVDLLYHTLRSLKQRGKSDEVRIPRYNKALRGGLGDRVTSEQWPVIRDSVDIVLFEGWMLGFRAKPALALTDTALAINEYQKVFPSASSSSLHESIQNINTKLKEYQKIHELFDSWIVFQTEDINLVYDWRLQAEHRMIEKGGKGLSDDQVRDFVARFMPAYHTFLKELYSNGPERKKDQNIPVMKVDIDSIRNPLRFSKICDRENTSHESKPLSKL